MSGYPYYLPQMNQYGFQPPMQRLQNFEQQYNQQFNNQQEFNQNQQPPSPPNNSNNGITWVQGYEGAKSYLLPHNSSAILMDSEDSIFYIKTTDNVGMPTTRAFEFREIQIKPKNQSQVNFDANSLVPRDEFDLLKDKVEKYEKLLDALTSPKVDLTKGDINNGKSTT